MHSQKVSFPSPQGFIIAATLDLPDGKPRGFALFSHCFAGSRFTPAAARVCKTLAELGIAALRFDYPGLGQSGGDFADTTFHTNTADLLAAYTWLERNYEAPQLLIGHSLGGAIALRASLEMPKVKALATIGAPFDPAHAVLHIADHISDADENGSVVVSLAGRDLTISRRFLEVLADLNPEDYMRRVRKPLLICHSPMDQTVGIDNAGKIFTLARYPKSLIALDKTDHLLTREGTAQRAGRLIATWASDYLDPRDDAAEPLPEGGANSVSVPVGRFADRVTTPRLELTTDRAKQDGGKNAGPSPDDLIAAALVSGVSEHVRQIAQADRVRNLDRVMVHAEPDPDGWYLHIDLKGELSDSDRDLLLAAAAQAPVLLTVPSAKLVEPRE